MCTVTYIPSKHGCCITSSRDEHFSRASAIAPEVYECSGIRMVYPKDAKANGSWIAFTETGNAAVLLNGAFEKHISQTPYRKSRGLIFLDIISSADPVKHFLEMDLYNIEPFTLVLYVFDLLFEARWDGHQKHFTQLDEKCNYIWSSCTLYTPEVIQKRKNWLERWLDQTSYICAKEMFNFHRFAGDGDAASNVLMKRDNGMLTVSITGIDIQTGAATMQYSELKENKHYLKTLALNTVTV